MPPISVHVAQTPALAEMLKDLLLDHGIPASVAPALHVTGWQEADPTEVWIADENDLERAQEIVREFAAGPSEPAGWGWRCPKCGEEVEPQFTACWKCGASREGP